ncbi:MAG: PHP domain-containing protein [Candidatus Nanopelagicales bacterium]
MTADKSAGTAGTANRDPIADLRRIAFLLERTLESEYRSKAFRNAAVALAGLPTGEIERLAISGHLRRMRGIGPRTAEVVEASLRGEAPEYLVKLEASPAGAPLTPAGVGLRERLRGDLHLHSDWSDGGAPISEMALTAASLGHEYAALTDHSPRLTVANGLSPRRLREQFVAIAELDLPAGFRLLRGIEVDIFARGALDQTDELLSELDVVVASVHSMLRSPAPEMTARLLAAVSNPHTDVLGHCTGRYVVGRTFGNERLSGQTRSGHPRPPSRFDADRVFAACADAGVAVEINSRPERLDPPLELLGKAVAAGCLFAIDTDAHAPGQLDWQQLGCERAEFAGVDPSQVVNTWPLVDLLAWTQDHAHRPQIT